VHRSIKLSAALWQQAVERADDRGFPSTNSYIRFLIKEDRDGAIEGLESRLAETVSQLAAQLKAIGEAQQATYATVWAILESVVPGDRIEEVRRRIAEGLKAAR
jgi:hypothetical protein